MFKNKEAFMQMDDEKITFENILITPLERWIDADVDLDPVAVERLNRLAALSNQSVDNVLNHILADFLRNIWSFRN